MKQVNVKPITDRIWVKVDPAEQQTTSGLYIPDNAQQKPLQGTIVAVGEGKYAPSTGVFIPMTVKLGDKVIYSQHVGTEITHEGDEYLVMKEEDLIAIVP